jgi:hypothetical protein
MRNQVFSLNSKKLAGILLSPPLISLTLFVVALVFSGCATSKSVKKAKKSVRKAYEVQKPIVVETSKEDKRPDWTKRTVFEENGSIYFSGGFLDGSDYSVTIRCLFLLLQFLQGILRVSLRQCLRSQRQGGELLVVW